MHSSDSDSPVPGSDTGWEWFTTEAWDWWDKQRGPKDLRSRTSTSSSIALEGQELGARSGSQEEMDIDLITNSFLSQSLQQPAPLALASDNDSEETTEVEDSRNESHFDTADTSASTSVSSPGEHAPGKRIIVDLSHAVHVEGGTTIYEDAIIYDTTKPPAPPSTSVDLPIEYIPTIGGGRSLRKRTIEQLYPYRVELERYRMNFKTAGINVTRKELRSELKSVQHEAQTEKSHSRTISKSPERRRTPVAGESPSANHSKGQGSAVVASRRGGRRIIDSDGSDSASDSESSVSDSNGYPVRWGDTNIFELTEANSETQSQSQDIFRPQRAHDKQPPTPPSNGYKESESSSNSSFEESEASSSDNDMKVLEEYKRKVKGVLPPSFITLEYSKYMERQKKKQNEHSLLEKARKRREKEQAVAQKGMARRKMGNTNSSNINGNSTGFWDGNRQSSGDEDSQPNTGLQSNGTSSLVADSYDNLSNLGAEAAEDGSAEDGSASDVRGHNEIDYMHGAATRKRTSSLAKKAAQNASTDNRRNRSSSGQKKTSEAESALPALSLSRSRKDSSRTVKTSMSGSVDNKNADATQRHRSDRKRAMLERNRQLSVADISQEMRFSQSHVPSFLDVAERTARMRTKGRPDDYNKKYIHIDSRYDDAMDSGSDEDVVSTVLHKWKSGRLINKRSTPSAGRARMRVARAAGAKGSSGRIVPQAAAHAPGRSRSSAAVTRSLSVKLRPSRESYVMSRVRQHSSTILEVPSGRYAIRHSKSKPNRPVMPTVTQAGPNLWPNRRVKEASIYPSNALTTAPPRAKKLMNPARKPSTEPSTYSREGKLHRPRQLRDIPLGEDMSAEQVLANGHSLRHFLQQSFPVTFDISRPPKDLWFAEDTLFGKDIVQQLLSTKSKFPEFRSLRIELNIDGSTLSFDEAVLPSSIGVITSAIKHWKSDDSHIDELYQVFEALSKTVMKCFAEECLDNIKVIQVAMLELLQAISLDPRRIFSTTMTVLVLHSTQKLLGRADGTYSNEADIDKVLGAGISALEILMVNYSDQLVELVRIHRSSLNRDIAGTSYLLELFAILAVVFDDISYMTKDPSRGVFGVLDKMALRDISRLPRDFALLERAWKSLYLVCYIKELVKPLLSNLRVLTWTWKTPYLTISALTTALTAHINGSNSSLGDIAGRYLVVTLHRCIHLMHHWNWPCDTKIVIDLFYFFAKNQFNNLEALSEISIPRVILSTSDITMFKKSDSAFEAFLKLVGITIWKIHDKVELRKMTARITPLNSRYYSRSSELKISDLGALCNQYSLLLMMFAHCPSEVRLSVLQLRDTSELNESHIRVRLLGVEAWKTCTAVLIMEDRDIGACMDWFDSMVLNTLDEFGKLEQTSTSVDIMENERRLENQQVYCTFFEQSLDMLLALFDYVYSLSSSSSSHWFQLLSKVCIRILDSHISPRVDSICLNIVTKFIDVSCGLSQKSAISIEVGASVTYFARFFEQFHRVVFNMISSESFSSDMVSENIHNAVKTEAMAANFLVSHGQYNWSSFVLSQFSWRWLPDSYYKNLLQPLWLQHLLKFGAYSCEPPLFLEFFIQCLVRPKITYEHEFCKEVLKVCDEPWINPLKNFISSLSTAASFVKHRPTLIKDMIVLLSKEQLHNEALVRQYVGYFLSQVKQNYIQMKGANQEQVYHGIAEFCMGLVVEYFELANIPNLQWFKNSVDFQNGKSITLDKAGVKRYLGLELNNGKSYNMSRLVMFIAYSLETSFISNDGANFVDSVSLALTESVCARKESCLYIINGIFARYIDLSSRDEFQLAECMLPTILKTFSSFIEGGVGISESDDYYVVLDSLLDYFTTVLSSSKPNLVYLDSAYYVYEALNVMLQASIQNLMQKKKPLSKKWLSIVRSFLVTAFKIVSVDYQSLDQDGAADQQQPRRQAYSNSDPAVMAIRQVLGHFKRDTVQSNSARQVFTRHYGSIGIPASDSSNRLVFYQKVSQRQAEHAILAYIKYCFQFGSLIDNELETMGRVLMTSLSSAQVDWLTLKSPHIGGWHHDKTLIDGYIV